MAESPIEKLRKIVQANPNANPANLSLLEGVERNDFNIISNAFVSGADIYLDMKKDLSIINTLCAYVDDNNIVKLIMEVLLENAIQTGSHTDIAFARGNGAIGSFWMWDTYNDDSLLVDPMGYVSDFDSNSN